MTYDDALSRCRDLWARRNAVPTDPKNPRRDPAWRALDDQWTAAYYDLLAAENAENDA